MAKCREEFPKTFTEYVGIVDAFQTLHDHSVWYRGCGKSEYKLIPSLYRYLSIKDIRKLDNLEYKLMTRFKQRSIPFHDKSLDDLWEALFFMQHSGVPTRLLDWTENPFIAFYFAVMSAEYKYKKKKKYISPASIWMLDPVAWNQHAFRHVSYDKGILSTPDEQLIGYIPRTKFSAMSNLPVALNGTHNSSRIVAQRGVFTIFGQNTASMEDLFETESFPNNCLIKVTIDKDLLPTMKKSILNNGITESVVFPDLDGLAREIRREFKLED
jgi:hypothetical protein